MRLVVVALLSALVGAGVATGTVLLLDDDDGAATSATSGATVRQAPLARQGEQADDDALTPAEIYKRDAPGVVFITAQVVQQTQSPFDLYPTEQRGESTGTGFVIDDDGSIVTNHHVVANARRVTVRFEDGTVVEAKVRGSDPSTDLALLSVDPDKAPVEPLQLGTSKDVQVGDPTVAIGNPFGLDLTLTTGVISAKQRQIEAPNEFTIEDVLQTDAAINPGNSGGPLIDALGRVIGVNSQIRTGGQGSEGSIGIGFAVPVDTVKRVVPDLRSKGRVDRAYLGVTSATTERGALVQDLVPGGPAGDAGIQPGDVITKIGDAALGADMTVPRAIDALKPGERVAVTVLRDGEEETVEVTLERRPDSGALDTVGP